MTKTQDIVIKKHKMRNTGVTIRDYKKTKNILMGTPASGSAKRVR